MKADYDCSGESEEVQVICTALKRYGMLVADIDWRDWAITGAPDDRWDDASLLDVSHIPGGAFEVVETGEVLQ